jgi:hypothetical protein
LHISLKELAPYAIPGVENPNPARRRVFSAIVSLAVTVSVAALVLLPGSLLAEAPETVSSSISAPLNTFAAYQPNLTAFPFAQPETEIPAQQPSSQTQPSRTQPSQTDEHPEVPDDPAAKKKGKSKPPIVDWYMRFVTGPTPKVLTPRDKAYIATRSIIDPFNVITILGEAGISVAADSHSAYGPGFPGFGRYVGVSFTENLTGEFFNTFLIPSLTHQDPRFHRIPQDPIRKRIFHAIYQVAWTQGDHGKRMLNYGNLLGFAIDDEIGNLYVPGRRTNASATAQRYVIGLATAPIDNFISEFLPDVAKHVHIQVVVVQRIINHIAGNDNNAL